MIKYRPHKGNLADAMKEYREFNTVEEMKKFIVDDWNNQWGHVMDVEDIEIGESLGSDERIGWESIRYVCTKRMGDEDYIKLYDCPQCIGMCDIGEQG